MLNWAPFAEKSKRDSLFKLSVLALALAGFVSANPVAQADEHPLTGVQRPVIEIGGGGQTLGSGLNILLKVGFSVRKYTNSPSEKLSERDYQEQLVIAHFSGDFGISTQGDGNRIPYLDIEFIPVDNHLEFVNTPGQLVVMGNLRFLPTELNRNLQIDEQLGVRVSAIGLQLDAIKYSDRNSGIIAQLAVDALGYKMVSYANGLGKFAGFHIAQAALEAGYATYINDSFYVRVALGGSADLNTGKNSGGESARQSDQDVYLSIKANIHEMIEIFLKAGFVHTTNSGLDLPNRTTPLLQGGATFIF
ncbi:MAG: hypothetical protein H7222_03520 [Methylotenera sp.]|nr:hypothetical protein [Oligoflexia bacterium]